MSGPRYFEDWRPGEEIGLGRYRVTAAEIKTFAAEFDPQPFHLDETAARASIFGGLVASGWHTCAVMMRLIAGTPELMGANIVSPGFDDLAWPTPVRPGDVLEGRCRVLDKRPSASKPDRGLVRFEQRLFNQHGEIVLRLTSLVLYLRRPATALAEAGGGGA